jgi:SAM-dependent methyltransferase
MCNTTAVPAQPLADIGDRIGIAAAIAAALRTGLLSELSKGPVGDDELAQRLGLDPRATTLLLDVLETVALARREDGRVGAGPALHSAGQLPGGHALVLGMWAHMEDFLRTGRPFARMDGSAAEREQAYRDVARGLATLFEDAARGLAARLALRPRAILDVGCGSGVWSLAFAERHPDVRATGLDLPSVLESFTARAGALGLADRVAIIPADMHEAAIPAGAFDLAIIANVLRLEPPERAARLVQRVAAGVAPGGALLVVDTLAAGTPERDRARAVYALHLGLRTRTGQVHPAATITSWLVDAGLARVDAIDIANGAGGLGGLGGLLATRR